MRIGSILPPLAKASECPSLAREAAGFERYPLWLWWNLLSLDAPTVVCLWALLFLHARNVTFRYWEIVALASAVWMIYAADRILDGLRKPVSLTHHERHSFYAKHSVVILAVLTPLFFATGWIGLARLCTQARLAGLVMTSAVIFYFLTIHGLPDRAGRWFPKEIAAGAIFAVGAALPSWIHATESRTLLPETLLFAGLCMLNCIAIECWEHNRGERRWTTAPYWLIRMADTRIMHAAILLFLCSAWLGIFVSRSGNSVDLLSATSVSLLMIMAIEAQSDVLSRRALRVLADVALLTPIVFLLRSVH